VPTDRLLGSYLLRVSVRDGARIIALHSVLTGEARRFDGFPALTAHLERITGRTEHDASPDEGADRSAP
jgi:hypothetical protein